MVANELAVVPAVPPAVLVVEDEMLLRMRAVDMVEDAGFTPIEAINADEALAILESRSDIELLFTDIQMPGSMDGLKLAYAVHERWPLIKIILVSGQLKLTDDDKPADSRFFCGDAGHDGQGFAKNRAGRYLGLDRESAASEIEQYHDPTGIGRRNVAGISNRGK
jgi:CheY-like chemotaxis protein